jgi:hypothetical protein
MFEQSIQQGFEPLGVSGCFLARDKFCQTSSDNFAARTTKEVAGSLIASGDIAFQVSLQNRDFDSGGIARSWACGVWTGYAGFGTKRGRRFRSRIEFG